LDEPTKPSNRSDYAKSRHGVRPIERCVLVSWFPGLFGGCELIEKIVSYLIGLAEASAHGAPGARVSPRRKGP
jgi:hypothetical protein